MEHYFTPGATYYVSKVSVDKKIYRHVNAPVNTGLIEAHLKGEISIAAPSAQNGLVISVTADVDSQDREPISRAMDELKDSGIPAYVSFSGGKGYHLTVSLTAPTLLNIAQSISQRLKVVLDSIGIGYCKISPSPYGKGGDCIKLPLGVHPETGNQCYFLDDNLQAVTNPSEHIKTIKSVDLVMGDCQSAASSTDDEVAKDGVLPLPTFPDKISSRQCVNKIWSEGLQESGTRHSATCVIANSVLRNPLIASGDKELAVVDWVSRTFPRVKDNEYINSGTNYFYAIEEAQRLHQQYAQYGTHAELCENQVFKSAMRSACEDEFKCKVEQNHGYINYRLLKKLGMFNAGNARPKGLGKSVMALYEAIEDIASDFQRFDVDGHEAFTLSTLQLIRLSNCSKQTVINGRKKLIEAGLLVEIDKRSIPAELKKASPYFVKYYYLPALTEELVRNMLQKLRGKGV